MKESNPPEEAGEGENLLGKAEDPRSELRLLLIGGEPIPLASPALAPVAPAPCAPAKPKDPAGEPPLVFSLLLLLFKLLLLLLFIHATAFGCPLCKENKINLY